MVEEKVYIEDELFPILKEVSDPEIPVLSVLDLGIVRVAKLDGKTAHVNITPTYSGCPAMDVIGDDIKLALREAGFEPDVNLVLSPAWSSDWITEEGRQALEDYGIAPPTDETADKRALMGEKNIIKWSVNLVQRLAKPCLNAKTVRSHLIILSV